ncbi:hypothetical protein [Lishizhenia sp.]|uniref:hypothetical protein n=1 Tax=Lishizhenia sp. TaxID=2497594 RepID=UPI00299E7D17|nr:hypothetical protein [Lishizhenia sp.]MDX1445600.1 hypothetical protein [Lishizhenia sp.]
MIKYIAIGFFAFLSICGFSQTKEMKKRALYYGKSNFISVSLTPSLKYTGNNGVYLEEYFYQNSGWVAPLPGGVSFKYYKSISGRILVGAQFCREKELFQFYPEYSQEHKQYPFVELAEVSRKKISMFLEFRSKKWAALPFASFSNSVEFGFDYVSAKDQELKAIYPTDNGDVKSIYPIVREENEGGLLFHTSPFIRYGFMNSMVLGKVGVIRFGFEMDVNFHFINAFFKNNKNLSKYGLLIQDYQSSMILKIPRIRLEYILPLF